MAVPARILEEQRQDRAAARDGATRGRDVAHLGGDAGHGLVLHGGQHPHQRQGHPLDARGGRPPRPDHERRARHGEEQGEARREECDRADLVRNHHVQHGEPDHQPGEPVVAIATGEAGPASRAHRPPGQRADRGAAKDQLPAREREHGVLHRAHGDLVHPQVLEAARAAAVRGAVEPASHHRDPGQDGGRRAEQPDGHPRASPAEARALQEEESHADQERRERMRRRGQEQERAARRD